MCSDGHVKRIDVQKFQKVFSRCAGLGAKSRRSTSQAMETPTQSSVNFRNIATLYQRPPQIYFEELATRMLRGQCSFPVTLAPLGVEVGDMSFANQSLTMARLTPEPRPSLGPHLGKSA